MKSSTSKHNIQGQYLSKVMINTGKLVKVVVPQYLSAAKSYALAADSSSS